MACCLQGFTQVSSDNKLLTAGTLPLQLLITVLSFLPGPRAIATCACVSRLWAKAAGLAVPKEVDVWDNDMQDILYLLGRRHLGAVETVSLQATEGSYRVPFWLAYVLRLQHSKRASSVSESITNACCCTRY